MDYILKFINSYGISDHTIISLILTSVLLISVIIIGFAMNTFEYYQMKLLSKFFGQRFACFFCNKLTFIGTVVHEYSHALFAVLTGAEVSKIRWFTLFSNNQLGYVIFHTRGPKFIQLIQLSLTSCAPVVTGLAILNVLLSNVMTNSYPVHITILLWYIIISVIDHMSMSKIDILNYIKGLIFLFPFLFLISKSYLYLAF